MGKGETEERERERERERSGRERVRQDELMLVNMTGLGLMNLSNQMRCDGPNRIRLGCAATDPAHSESLI